MTSFSAKSDYALGKPRDVVFVIYPDIVLLDLAGPLQVFSHARAQGASKPAYRTHVASHDGGKTQTNTVLQVESETLSNWVAAGSKKPIHTLVVIGGDGAYPAIEDTGFVNSIKSLSERAHRVCSVCSGALVLAAAGLLDGRRAVTHWEDCEALARMFPDVTVEVDPIFVKDGSVWTSAGITAGIDMALAIVEEDLGKPSAIAMARSLVTPMVRSGGQSQFSADLDRQAHDKDGRFEGLHHWIRAHIHERITVDIMAAQCAMSGRNFSRLYKCTMGVSPAKALEAMRVDTARDLLSGTRLRIKTIARRCGFQDVERMRRAFLRSIHTSPSDYRKQFRTGDV